MSSFGQVDASKQVDVDEEEEEESIGTEGMKTSKLYCKSL